MGLQVNSRLRRGSWSSFHGTPCKEDLTIVGGLSTSGYDPPIMEKQVKQSMDNDIIIIEIVVLDPSYGYDIG